MIHNLYVLRHGIAFPHGTPGMAEADRPLTDKGVAHMKQVARGIDRLGLKLDRVVTSPLPRARQTAEIVTARLGLDDRLEVAEILTAGASPPAVRDWLAGRTEERLMIVGHNPDLSDLVALMLALPHADHPPFELKKGGLASLRANPEGGYLLQWFATPRLIRRLS